MILTNMPNSFIRWAAVIHGVQEVVLAGVADLAYWRNALKREGLCPFNANGSAEILISAPRLIWMGLRFCEMSISISVARREDAPQPDGTFLAHAFNSSRLLALSERTFFGTPYYAADIHVTTDMPVGFSVSSSGSAKRQLAARMTAQPPLLRSGDEHWAGPIFLPRVRTAADAPRKYFMAQLTGNAQAYAFAAGTDVLELNPAEPNDIFAELRDSGFAAREWRVRLDGTHAKSRTMTE